MLPRNDRALPLSAFCLELEKHRRTPEGRLGTAEAFVQFYFGRANDTPSVTDRIFLYLPPEVRGPIIAGWRIRGLKAALRDDDERVKSVVLDALDAGDLDPATFEDGIPPETLIDYTPLTEWWLFWKSCTPTNAAVQKALASARSNKLIDDAWFLANATARDGKLRATDALAETLTKDDVIGWVRGIHASGDATPAGIIQARGWDTLLAKTAPATLRTLLDAFAAHVGLAGEPSSVDDRPTSNPQVEPPPGPAGARPGPSSASNPPRVAIPALDLSDIDPDAAPLGGWGDDAPPQSLPGDVLIDDKEPVTSNRPPPLPK